MALTDSDIMSAGGYGATAMGRYWPVIVAALKAEGIAQDPVLAAAAATLRAEVGASMAPVTEGAPSSVNPYTYFESVYGADSSIGRRLGNTVAGDGYKYRGRGFIQLSGRSNYGTFGRRVKQDLLSQPDLALNPTIAAQVFAAYFKDRGVAAAANRGDWQAVRRLVNGGYNGWEQFIAVINKLPNLVASNTALGGVALLIAATAAYLIARKA